MSFKYVIMFNFILPFYILLCCYLNVIQADCNVVSKKSWGGRRPTHVQYLPRPVHFVTTGVTNTRSCNTDGACEELVRNIQTNHMDNLNYWDIGYNFLIGGNGKVYEGRGWLYAGEHTPDYNNISIGIIYMGRFNILDLSDITGKVKVARDLMQCGVERGHLSANSLSFIDNVKPFL